MATEADPTAIAAIITAAGTAFAGVAAVFKGRSDGKSVNDRVDALDTVLAALVKRIDTLAATADPRLRHDLDALAENVRRYRAAQRAGSAPSLPSGTYPAVPVDVGRWEEHERRLVAAETRANKNEERIDRLDAWFDDARVMIARVETHLEHLLSRRSVGPGDRR